MCVDLQFLNYMWVYTKVLKYIYILSIWVIDYLIKWCSHVDINCQIADVGVSTVPPLI
jgi:hypothetical protein